MKIKVIIPNAGMDRATLDSRERMLSAALSEGTQISVDCIENGPESIESNTDEVLAGTEVLKLCVKAEKEGFDAVVIYCFSDLAIQAARELVHIPVIGPGEVALAAAEMISVRFAVITTVSGNVSRTERRLMGSPIAREKMKAVLPLDIPVIALRDDPQATIRYLKKACETAISEHHVDTIILGCLGMAQYGEELENEFGIKVLDPAFLAVGYAEYAARLGIVPSGKASPAYRHEIRF